MDPLSIATLVGAVTKLSTQVISTLLIVADEVRSVDDTLKSFATEVENISRILQAVVPTINDPRFRLVESITEPAANKMVWKALFGAVEDLGLYLEKLRRRLEEITGKRGDRNVFRPAIRAFEMLLKRDGVNNLRSNLHTYQLSLNTALLMVQINTSYRMPTAERQDLSLAVQDLVSMTEQLPSVVLMGEEVDDAGNIKRLKEAAFSVASSASEASGSTTGSELGMPLDLATRRRIEQWRRLPAMEEEVAELTVGASAASESSRGQQPPGRSLDAEQPSQGGQLFTPLPGLDRENTNPSRSGASESSVQRKPIPARTNAGQSFGSKNNGSPQSPRPRETSAFNTDALDNPIRPSPPRFPAQPRSQTTKKASTATSSTTATTTTTAYTKSQTEGAHHPRMDSTPRPPPPPPERLHRRCITLLKTPTALSRIAFSLRVGQFIFALASCFQWIPVVVYFADPNVTANFQYAESIGAISAIFVTTRFVLACYNKRYKVEGAYYRHDRRFWWVVFPDFILCASWIGVFVFNIAEFTALVRTSPAIQEIDNETLMSTVEPSITGPAAWLGFPNALLWCLSLPLEFYRWWRFDRRRVGW